VIVRESMRFRVWAPELRTERSFSFHTLDELWRDSNTIADYASWLQLVSARAQDLRDRVLSQGWVSPALRIEFDNTGGTAEIEVTAREDA
jgi:hypothetical protein